MKKITWFKDMFGDVYIWADVVVPYPTTLDTSDFCINGQNPIVNLFVPSIGQADINDWGYEDIPFELRIFENDQTNSAYSLPSAGIAV